MNSTDFYTYAYLRKDGTPYYVGKGKDFRAFSKNRVGIKLPKDKSRIIFLKQNLTEEEAFNHEIYMISVFGRKDLGTGILRNRTDGGEGTSNPSEETRKRIGKASKCRIRSEETRKKMSEIALITGKCKGSKNPAAKAILAFDKDGNFIGKYETAREAAEDLNIGQCWKHIPSVCKGERKHTCGYVFKYANNEQ